MTVTGAVVVRVVMLPGGSIQRVSTYVKDYTGPSRCLYAVREASARDRDPFHVRSVTVSYMEGGDKDAGVVSNDALYEWARERGHTVSFKQAADVPMLYEATQPGDDPVLPAMEAAMTRLRRRVCRLGVAWYVAASVAPADEPRKHRDLAVSAYRVLRYVPDPITAQSTVYASLHDALPLVHAALDAPDLDTFKARATPAHAALNWAAGTGPNIRANARAVAAALTIAQALRFRSWTGLSERDREKYAARLDEMGEPLAASLVRGHA